ncbi:MAG: pitrilysin family protein [Bacilli bacterium]
MKIINYNNQGDLIYTEKLSNGLSVYMFNKETTDNFYVTIGVKYASKVLKYKKDNIVYNVTPGIAHFLEHRVMDFTNDKTISNKIESLGSFTNAYTSYDGTNYNISGSKNIKDNIEILLEKVFSSKFTKESVENEKGIIIEEIGMTNDRANTVLWDRADDNLFFNSYIKNSILGTIDDVKSITYKELKRVYNDFYVPSNMFIVVVGNFNKEETLDTIKNYFKDKTYKLFTSKVLKPREKEQVKINYEEIEYNIEKQRFYYSIKIHSKYFDKIKPIYILKYIELVLGTNFGEFSDFYTENDKKYLFTNFSTSSYKIDNYYVINIAAVSDHSKDLIEKIKEKFKNLIVTKEDLIRYKRLSISWIITLCDDMFDVEELLSSTLYSNNKFKNKEKELIDYLNIEDTNKVIKVLSKMDNTSILKVNPKK